MLARTSGDAAAPIGLRVEAGNDHAPGLVQSAPLCVEVIGADGQSVWLRGGYARVTPDARPARVLRAAGTLISPGGSRFRVADTFRAAAPGGGFESGAFEVTRQIDVEEAAPNDAAFGSRFMLAPPPASLSDEEFFAPGVWYRDNHFVPPSALAADPGARYFLFREDRLPLPLVMERDKRSGATFTLEHLQPDGATFAGEDGLARLVDARLQFGSLGVINDEFANAPQLAFQFPGSEGERTYTFGARAENNRWALRSHPLRAGVPHRFRLRFSLGQTPGFADAVRSTWKAAYERAQPPVVSADLDKVYRDGMELLSHYCRAYNGAISVPFQARVPDGQVIDTSSQMGFVGQALPSAFLLLQHGLDTGDEDAVGRASQDVDFWATNCMSEAGVPRTWYDIAPDGRVSWRDYPTFLRVASDGMDGALQAWNSARQANRAHPDWLAFCRRYGDWLVRVQNPDGSFFRSYNFDGTPRDRTRDTTIQPIRFLVDLYKATGEARYKLAAQRAGEFCWRTVHEPYAYVGGTPDNPNVTDKEAGVIALDAFLALHDLTGEARFLQAATQAAWYSETWVYAWNVPMPPDDPNLVFPRNRTTVGLSLIATGHSGSDNFMAAAPFLYYRLFLLTGETQFRDFARMLLFNTKQLLDWDGTLGYALPGLQTEAMSLPPLRGHGVQGWLPWLTVASIEPMLRLRQTFGQFDINDIERQPHAEVLRRNARFAATRGFTRPDLGAPRQP